MSAGTRRFAILFALVSAPGSAKSQTTTAGVDFTAANTSYAGTFSGTSLAVSPFIHVDAPLSVLDAGLTYSSLAGSWTSQGGASGSLFTPRASHFMGEIAGMINGSSHEDGTRSGSFGGIARLHMLSASQGFWIGGGGGRGWDGITWRNLIQGEAGAWTSLPGGSLSIVINPTKLGDTTRYTDTETALSVFRDRAGLDLNAGFRAGSSLPITGGNNRSWGSATGSYWLTNSIALMVSGGTYPVDFGQGFPGGKFISAGVRLGSIPTKGRRSTNTELPAAASSIEGPIGPDASGPTNLLVSKTSSGDTRISVTWPAASKVEIAGDFSNWDPVPLSREPDGAWYTVLHLRPGIYEMNIRVDGGDWLPPPGLERKNDEFGGSVGLLIVRM